ncbi:uncharacterized protein LOC130808863 [Amaranthus tricolor]|uniref:uncharacterized protein LOC130808863 n=1 Tax=Amaranthus tricolor TaxID=29722 RepID=UPI00258FFB31|nr:uncharacterized protein LOC130808863 [Amaranthus tricolor]
MVVTAVIVGNGRMCSALDMDEVADAVCPKIYENEIISGKCMDNQDNEEGVQNLMDETKDISSDVKKYSSREDNNNVKEIYNEAKQKVEEVKNGYSEEAKAKHEAAKEKDSDAVGEVGAKMRQ